MNRTEKYLCNISVFKTEFKVTVRGKGRMAQWVNSLAVKANTLSLIQATHMVEGEKQLLQVDILCTVILMHPHAYLHIYTIKWVCVIMFNYYKTIQKCKSYFIGKAIHRDIHSDELDIRIS